MQKQVKQQRLQCQKQHPIDLVGFESLSVKEAVNYFSSNHVQNCFVLFKSARCFMKLMCYI